MCPFFVSLIYGFEVGSILETVVRLGVEEVLFGPKFANHTVVYEIGDLH